MSEISDISLISRKIKADFLIDLGIRKKEIIINTKFLLIITIFHLLIKKELGPLYVDSFRFTIHFPSISPNAKYMSQYND